MSSTCKIKLSTPELSNEIQCQVAELQAVLRTQQLLNEVFKSDGDSSGRSAENSNDLRKLGNNLLMQKGHNVKTHREILSRYTQSIAYAPLDSEELVLGYGNRSALLMHLKFYEEALVDIDRALELSKSDDYKKKMQARKDKCLGLLNKQNLIKSTKDMTSNENEELEKIRSKVENFKPSDKVACAADCVDVAYSDQVGRCLVATRDIKPGELIIVEEGYASAPAIDRIYIFCSHCLEYAFNGIACDKCIFTIYCSEICKNKAFHEYHDIKCLIYTQIMNMIFFDMKSWQENSQKLQLATEITVALRILIKALKNKGFENVMKEIFEEKNADNFEVLLTDGILKSDFKACYNLLPWRKDAGEEYDNLMGYTLSIICLLVERTDILESCITKNSSTKESKINLYQPIFNDDGSITVDPRLLLKLRDALMKLKFIVTTNEHAFETATWQCGCNNVEEHDKICKYWKGVVIVPSCSLINHSCTANVAFVCASKRKIVVYSVCPIKKGEMLCSSYNSIDLSTGNVKVRGLKLENFICKCRACSENIELSMVMNDRNEDLEKFANMVMKKFPASMATSFLYPPFESYEISKEIFQHVIKMSQLLYKHFNYYKADAHNFRCSMYFDKVMAKLYKDKVFIPNNC